MEMQSETVGKIATALAKAQGEIPPIPKKKTAKVNMKGGGSYSYSYADFNDVRDAVQPVLSANGLAFVQCGSADARALVTTLVHGESGEWFRSVVPIFDGQNGGAQGYGSGMTYAKRYGLCGILGISADEDDDGRGASGYAAKQTPPPNPAPKADDKPDPQAFAARVVDVIKNTDDGEKLAKWWAANSAKLDKLKAMSVSLFDHVETQYQNRLGVLAQTPPKETADDEECPF